MPFSVNDRELLAQVKGVGPLVIARLEQMGYSTLSELAGADVQHIVETAASLTGSSCWKNSPQAKAAIQGAINAAAHGTPARSDHSPPALQSVPNFGPKSAAILAAAGINSLEQLAALGAVAAFAIVKRSGARVSLNLLWAMEGALTGESWQTVAREHKTSLLLALESYETNA